MPSKMTRNKAVEAVVAGADSDATYDALCPHDMQPHEVERRNQVAKAKDKDAKQEEVSDDYISRHDFRELVAAARKKAEKKTETTTPTVPTPAD